MGSHVFAIPDELGSCGFYRAYAPFLLLEQASKERQSGSYFTLSQVFAADLNYYNTLYIQRWHQKVRIPFIDNIKQLRQKHGLRLVHDIDDLTIKRDIPEYNQFRNAFADDPSPLYYMLDAADFVTCSTPALRRELLLRHDFNPDRLVICPNHVPEWWSGAPDRDKAQRIYRENAKRHRILFCCSSSHANCDGKPVADDFSGVVDWVIANRKKYQFVFVGCLPYALLKYRDDFECHGAVPILNYMTLRNALHCSVLIQPLQDNMFNRCKSDIKALECYANAIPFLAQNIECYNRHPREYRFDNAEEMDEKLSMLLSNEETYLKAVDYGINRHQEDKLEKNLDVWQYVLAFKL